MQSIGVARTWRGDWIVRSLVVLLLASQLGAQTVPGTDEPAISIRATTRMVVVDLVVTDKHGAPVTDLAPEDVTLLEDGKPEKIALFAGYPESGKRPSPPETAVPSALAPDVYTNRPEYHRESGPLTILLLDALNTATMDQSYARQQMLHYLRTQLKPDERVAIMALTGDLIVLQSFTTDSRVLLSALQNYSPKTSIHLSQGQPFLVTPLMASLMYPRTLESLEAVNQARAIDSIDNRVRLTLAALQALARAMLGYPGRKNLVWVSAVFPFSLSLSGTNSTLSRNYGDDILRAGRLLADAQVAVYTVDARGLFGLASPPPSPNELVPTVESPDQPGYGEAEMTRSDLVVQNSHEAMQELAKETGGRAFYNLNDLAHAVTTSIADGSSYYTLGYYPQNKRWDGKFRRIEVKSQRKGINVRARVGYYAFDSSIDAAGHSSKPVTDRTGQMLAAVSAPLPATGVTFQAHVVPAASAGEPFSLEFLVDANTLSFESEDKGIQHSNVEFAVFSVSAAGKIIDSQGQSVETLLNPVQYTAVTQRGLPFRMQVKSLPETRQLLLGVRDNRTGLLGTLSISLPAEAATQKSQ